MFIVEIDFKDESGEVETLMVKRPTFVLGSSERANVVVEDMEALDYELEFRRGLGPKFYSTPLLNSEGVKVPEFLSGEYTHSSLFEIGPFNVRVAAVDADLLYNMEDSPDFAGARILKRACAFPSPVYPALVVQGDKPVTVSFPVDSTVVAGRSNKCFLRVDSPDVSSVHARFGYESGKFWVEDLGSTNGTYVEDQQISGRYVFNPGIGVRLGGSVIVVGVDSELQYTNVLSQKSEKSDLFPAVRTGYPAVVSLSELVRPARFSLTPGSTVVLGRDPDSDIWVGAPHVSRKHCVFSVSKSGVVSITDCSRNGIAYRDKLLEKNKPFILEEEAAVFDIGAGITFSVCFTAEDEEAYKMSGGSFSTFYSDSISEDEIKDSLEAVPGVADLSYRASESAERREDSLDFAKYAKVKRFYILGGVFIIAVVTFVVIAMVLFMDGLG
ncbi:MAG: FHA domain-containing protein [Candidatus Dadabacteria bacterium]|nr:MAG: FHA domain-containing protein [Candidatus Dadabacteria bacterium]